MSQIENNKKKKDILCDKTVKKVYHAGIYARLSVDTKTKKSESVENQTEFVEKYIDRVNLSQDFVERFEIYDVYKDKGISGTTFERRDFERLMQDVSQKKVDCILVKDLSRFGRDYIEIGRYIEKILPFLGCRFIAVADGYDSMSGDADTKILTMNIKNLINDMYAKDISQKVICSKKVCAANGSYVGGIAPYGYDVISEATERKLKINEECAEVIRQIFRLYSEGESVKNIAEYLYMKQIHNISAYRKYGDVLCREGQKLSQWSESSIRNILKNPDYTEMISGEILNDIKNNRMKKKKDICESDKNAEEIYKGMMFCGYCKAKLHTSCYKSRQTGEVHYSYHCRNAYRIDDKKCTKNYITQDKITIICTEVLRQISEEECVDKKALAEFDKKLMDETYRRYQREKQRLRQECEYKNIALCRMYECFRQGYTGVDEFTAFRDKIRKETDYIKKVSDESDKKLCAADYDRYKEINSLLLKMLIEKIYVLPDGSMDIIFRFRRRENADCRVLPVVGGR